MKRKAPKQKPLIKSFGPINKHATKMKAWDDIAKSTKHYDDGFNSKESNLHDGLEFNDESYGKLLPKFYVPKIAAKM